MAEGDSFSGDLFAIELHPELIELYRACQLAGCQARAGHDDIFVQGPTDIVISAIIKFADAIKKRCTLQLQWCKPSIFTWKGVLPKGLPEGVKLAGQVVDDTFEVGYFKIHII